MGDKVSAIRAMKETGVPCVPGSDGPLSDDMPLNHTIAKRIGFRSSSKPPAAAADAVCALSAMMKIWKKRLQ